MKIKTEYVLQAKPEEVYGYFLNADNMSEAWPPEMRMRIISREGNLFTVKFNYLGQQYTATFKIEELGGLRQYHETLDFPFGALRHWITVEPHDSGSKLTEVMELRSPNPLAGPIFRRILRYREQAIKHHFGAAPKPVFKDPLKIGLVAGTVASILPTILAYMLLFIPPPPFPGGRFIIALISWALLWFFTHDLAHLFVGMLAGIRFSHYYIGLSNIVRLGIIPKPLKTLPAALGIKIDRERSRATPRGYAAMYAAGPIASMLFPLTVPLIILAQNPSSLAGLILTGRLARKHRLHILLQPQSRMPSKSSQSPTKNDNTAKVAHVVVFSSFEGVNHISGVLEAGRTLI
jgi:hypothetical protein